MDPIKCLMMRTGTRFVSVVSRSWPSSRGYGSFVTAAGPVKIPHSVRIGPNVYRIRWGSSTDRYWQKHRAKPGGAGHVGNINYQKKLITLHPGQRATPTEALSTFVHEILHGVNMDSVKRGYWYVNESGRTVPWRPMKHNAIYALEGPISRFLEDNGATLKCVCGPCNKPKRSKRRSRGKGRSSS